MQLTVILMIQVKKKMVPHMTHPQLLTLCLNSEEDDMDDEFVT
jgi:hypothetical protein